MAVTLPTVDEVRLIISTAISDAQITAIINDAYLIVENCVAPLAAARQTAIVKWVTAHLISAMGSSSGGASGAVTQSSLGDASESYSTAALGEQLKGSSYGQQALLLDPNNCLARLGQRAAYFKVL